jgi:predicted CoA-binding protein
MRPGQKVETHPRVLPRLLRFDRDDLWCYTEGRTPGGYTNGAEGRKRVASQSRLLSDFVGRRVWAVVGASQDPSKFGYRVFRNLQQAGYTVFPVNPKGGELLGVQVYRSLAELPQPPEVVDAVVQPHVTEKVVQEMHDLGLPRVWMQPGSESDVAIAYCREHGIQVVYDACAMVHRRQWD